VMDGGAESRQRANHMGFGLIFVKRRLRPACRLAYQTLARVAPHADFGTSLMLGLRGYGDPEPHGLRYCATAVALHCG
jgi:hypothetical protein